MNISIVIKLLTSSCYFLAGLLLKKLLNVSPFYQVIFIRALFSALFLFLTTIIAVTFSPALLIHATHTTWFDWISTILLSVLGFGGLFFYAKSMQTGRYSFTTSLAGIATIVSIISSTFILGQAINYRVFVALAMLIAGITVHQYPQLRQLKFTKEVLYIVVTNILWGFSFAITILPVRAFGVLIYSTILEGSVLLYAAVYKFYRDRSFVVSFYKKNNKTIAISGLLIAIGNIAASYSFQALPISTNIVIGMLFESLIILAGIWHFKEKLTIRDCLLIIFVTISATIMAINSSKS